MKCISQDQYEVLQELTNISMGQAGAVLAKLLDAFIQLSVPKVILIDVEEAKQVIPDLIGSDSEVTIARQAFYDQMDGESFVIYSRQGCFELANIINDDKANHCAIDDELVLDITNILVGACMSSLSDQLGIRLSYTPPSIFEEQTRVESFFQSHTFQWKQTLLFKVAFRLEEGSFASHILIFLSESSLENLTSALDQWLETL